jgi:hypothetical protein
VPPTLFHVARGELVLAAVLAATRDGGRVAAGLALGDALEDRGGLVGRGRGLGGDRAVDLLDDAERALHGRAGDAVRPQVLAALVALDGALRARAVLAVRLHVEGALEHLDGLALVAGTQGRRGRRRRREGDEQREGREHGDERRQLGHDGQHLGGLVAYGVS